MKPFFVPIVLVTTGLVVALFFADRFGYLRTRITVREFNDIDFVNGKIERIHKYYVGIWSEGMYAAVGSAPTLEEANKLADKTRKDLSEKQK